MICPSYHGIRLQIKIVGFSLLFLPFCRREQAELCSLQRAALSLQPKPTLTAFGWYVLWEDEAILPLWCAAGTRLLSQAVLPCNPSSTNAGLVLLDAFYPFCLHCSGGLFVVL